MATFLVLIHRKTISEVVTLKECNNSLPNIYQCDKHCFGILPRINCFVFMTTLYLRISYFSHFIGKKTEAQIGYVTCPGPHSSKELEFGLESR